MSSEREHARDGGQTGRTWSVAAFRSEVVSHALRCLPWSVTDRRLLA